MKRWMIPLLVVSLYQYHQIYGFSPVKGIYHCEELEDCENSEI